MLVEEMNEKDSKLRFVEDGLISGSKIGEIHTRKSLFDGNNVAVIIEGKTYMLNCKEILRMANEFNFNVEKKAKYKYLIPMIDPF